MVRSRKNPENNVIHVNLHTGRMLEKYLFMQRNLGAFLPQHRGGRSYRPGSRPFYAALETQRLQTLITFVYLLRVFVPYTYLNNLIFGDAH